MSIETPETSSQRDETVDEKTPNVSTTDEWHASMVGLGVVGFDVALMLGIAASTTRLGDHLVPWEVYMFGALGALAYVFRSLLYSFDQSTTQLLRANVQVLAAIPLSAGIYLLSDAAHPAEPKLELVAGTSFVVGLFVDLAYDALTQVADRVLPQRPDTDQSATDSDSGRSHASRISGEPEDRRNESET